MYDQKSTDYFTHTRVDIINSLGGKTFQNVLELGAGGCDTLIYMKTKGLAQNVTGVELFKIPNSNQSHPELDNLYIESIENLSSLPLKKDFYDLVICGDILEHVFDPWTVLTNIKAYLKTEGILVCSIPNFRDIQNMKTIFLNGNFKYNSEGGILDLTHVRFFCKKNILELFTKTGYSVSNIAPSFKFTKTQSNRNSINKITLGIFEEFLAFQYIVSVKKVESVTAENIVVQT